MEIRKLGIHAYFDTTLHGSENINFFHQKSEKFAILKKFVLSSRRTQLDLKFQAIFL